MYRRSDEFGYRSTQEEAAVRQKIRRSETSVFTAGDTSNCPDYQKGDMVTHAAFGKGMVLSVMKMGGDALLEIAFDQIGTEKLMAKTASDHMKKLS